MRNCALGFALSHARNNGVETVPLFPFTNSSLAILKNHAHAWTTRGIHSEEFEGIDQLDPTSVKELFGHPPKALIRELRW